MLTEKPTPETHPDIFGEYRAGSPYWRDTFFKDAAQKFLIESPRDFAMAMSMRDEFNRTTKEISLARKVLARSGVAAGFMLFPIIAIYGGSYITETVDGNNNVGAITTALTLIAGLTFALVITAGGILLAVNCLYALDTGEFHFTREPKFTIIALKYATAEKLNLHRSQRKVAVALYSIVRMSDENLNSVDLHAFARAYDDYMDMFTFVLANRNELSATLLDEYVESLDAKAAIVAEEARKICAITQSREEFIAQANEESREMQQEFTDIQARTMMPPNM